MPTDQNIIKVNINDIVPSKLQPRKVFNEETIKELALSIKTYGILNPLLVRKINDKYELVAGERRYRAAKMLGLTAVPVIIKELTDNEVIEIALIENIQRNDLNPIEEAKAYKEILSLNNLTQEELGKKIGKVQSSISNKMRLLNLSEEVIDAILNGNISERHGRLLLKLDLEDQNKVLSKIIENKLSIKETEELINQKSTKNNILDVLNSIDIDNKDSNVFNDKESEIKEKGEDNMNNNNNIGVGSFFPQMNNNQQNNSETSTIMFNNNPMNTSLPRENDLNIPNNQNTVPLSTLSQEPPINTINPTIPEITIPSSPIAEPTNPGTIANINVSAPSPIDNNIGIPEMPSLNIDIPQVSPIENNEVEKTNVNIEIPTPSPVEPIIPQMEPQAPIGGLNVMPEPPLFNPNASSINIEPSVSVEPTVNTTPETPNTTIQTSSLEKIKELLSGINDPNVTYKEYSNQDEKCIIISIKE